MSLIFIPFAVVIAMHNPLLPLWSGPHGGVPPFDQVRVEHFQSALEAAMAEQLVEIERIADDPAAPTFENTLAAMESSGRTFDRVRNVYAVHSATMKTPAFQVVERVMAPKLSEFRDRIVQNAKLFKRIAAVYEARAAASLTPEQQRLAWNRYTDFVRSGARLDARAKTRLTQINQRLATLYTQFSQNVLADEEHYLLIDAEEGLAGLPEALRGAAAAAADQLGHKGKWAILNTRSGVEPFLTFAWSRVLREKVWRTFYSRGDNNDARDNKQVIQEIVKLRAERAQLLGYRSHAHWRTEKAMAKTPERAMALMQAVWTPAVARAREEVADMQVVNNMLAAANLAAGCEAMAMASKLGLGLDQAADVVNASSGASWIFADRMARALRGDYAPRAAARVLLKDVGLFVQEARNLGLTAPMAECAREIFHDTVARGLGEEDDAAVLKRYSEAWNVEIRGQTPQAEGEAKGSVPGFPSVS